MDKNRDLGELHDEVNHLFHEVLSTKTKLAMEDDPCKQSKLQITLKDQCIAFNESYGKFNQATLETIK